MKDFWPGINLTGHHMAMACAAETYVARRFLSANPQRPIALERSGEITPAQVKAFQVQAEEYLEVFQQNCTCPTHLRIRTSWGAHVGRLIIRCSLLCSSS